MPLCLIVSTIGSPTYALTRHMTGLLHLHIGLMDTYVRDSAHFMEKLIAEVRPDDILISSDIVSMFTIVSLQETLEHINSGHHSSLLTSSALCQFLYRQI